MMWYLGLGFFDEEFSQQFWCETENEIQTFQFPSALIDIVDFLPLAHDEHIIDKSQAFGKNQ